LSTTHAETPYLSAPPGADSSRRLAGSRP